MANAIKKISVQRGYDVTEYALTCFGGAGGQTGCRVADSLGMKTVILHPFSGILSAYGMGLADIRADRQQAVVKTLTDDLIPELQALRDQLASQTEANSTGSRSLPPRAARPQPHTCVTTARTRRYRSSSGPSLKCGQPSRMHTRNNSALPMRKTGRR